MVRVKNPQVGWAGVGQKHGTRRQWTCMSTEISSGGVIKRLHDLVRTQSI